MNQTDYVNIAYHHIQDRRAQKNVPLSPFGNLHDYVPFYFAPRSPMLYSISRGCVQGYEEGQTPIIHLVTTVETIARAEIPFVFTDGHAVMAFSNYYKKIDDLSNIDWDIMKSKHWCDTNQDPDRKRKRQAEFLVHNKVPWSLILFIGVKNSNAAKVAKILNDFGCSTEIGVRNKWYY